MQKNTLVNPRFTKPRLLGYFLKDSAVLFAITVIASIIMTFLNTLIPKIIGFTIDSVIGDAPVDGGYDVFISAVGGIEVLKDNIWIIAVTIVCIAAVMFVFRYMSTYFNHRANQTFVKSMRNGLFTHIQRLPLSEYAAYNTGDVIQRCTSDIDTISRFVSEQLVSLIRIALLLTLSLMFMFMTDVPLAAIASAFLPLIVGLSLFFFLRARKKFQKCDEEEGRLSAYAQENLTGVRVVRAFGRERYEHDKFEKQNTYYTGLWVGLEKFMAMFWSASDMLSALQLLCIIVFGTLFCVKGDMTAGDLVTFISYNAMMIGPVRQLGRIISNLSKANVALGRIAEIMNAEEEDTSPADSVSGDIVFDNVSFGYDDGRRAVDGVSFTVKEGNTLGIIGSTGSGKSTLAALLDGLYKPTSGRITIGGRDISGLSPATLRENIGFILQEGHIYSRTIGENIALAADGAGDADIRAAAKAACVDGDIENFKNGYDTPVGERGVTLSGGQKQRVAIARTLLRKTPYLVFDDSLSAVDSETDAKIRASLKEEQNGVTTVIISHRINTVMHADEIIVMKDGRIEERGTHAELVAEGGEYARIYKIQTSVEGGDDE